MPIALKTFFCKTSALGTLVVIMPSALGSLVDQMPSALKTIAVQFPQLYGHSRQGGCGVCQGISMGSETLTTPKRFNSPLTQNKFSIFNKIPVINKVEKQLFPIDLKCQRCFNKKSYNENQ